MHSPNASLVVLAAVLLVGSPAMLLAQGATERPERPAAGSADRAGSDAGSRGGGSAWSGTPGAGSAAAVSGSSGGSNWSGSSGAGSVSEPRDGGTAAVRPRDGGPRGPLAERDAAGRRRDDGAGSPSASWYSGRRGDVPATGSPRPGGDATGARPPGSGGASGYPMSGGSYYPGSAWDQGFGYGSYGWTGGWYLYPWTWDGAGSGYTNCGYGSIGAGFYNPFGSNAYGGCGGYGSGFGSSYGFNSYGFGGGGVGAGGYSQQPSGGLRLKVEPEDARIYVDGYFAGTVDHFNGRFQKLPIDRGTHKIEISAPGYAPLVFDVEIKEHETVTREGHLEKVK